MDGALRAPSLSSGNDRRHSASRQRRLQQTLNEPSKYCSNTTDGGSTSGIRVPIGPPLYGEWHAKAHSISPAAPAWFREENLDIRARAAAGLGAEVIRANQEVFAQSCWEQVERILDANALLSRARLAIEANARAHAKSVVPMPPDRLLQLSSPLHARVLHAAVTVRRRSFDESSERDDRRGSSTSHECPASPAEERDASRGDRVAGVGRRARRHCATPRDRCTRHRPVGLRAERILGVTGLSTADDSRDG